MQEIEQLEKDLLLLGLMDKAREIYSELGESASLSYLRSSHRLLSKVYHPDLNPGNEQKAREFQQRLNRVSEILGRLKDEQVLDLIKRRVPKERDTSKRRILVVEDEFGLQELFRDIFLMEGYEVKVAVDGDQGYQLYRQFDPDLVSSSITPNPMAT